MLIIGALVAATFGILLGAPTLRLRGDYLAIGTLGFGEIVCVFLNNLDAPVNITNGPKGLAQIDSIKFFGLDLGRSTELFGFKLSSVTLYYYLFLVLVIFTVIICYRLERSRCWCTPWSKDRWKAGARPRSPSLLRSDSPARWRWPPETSPDWHCTHRSGS